MFLFVLVSKHLLVFDYCTILLHGASFLTGRCCVIVCLFSLVTLSCYLLVCFVLHFQCNMWCLVPIFHGHFLKGSVLYIFFAIRALEYRLCYCGQSTFS